MLKYPYLRPIYKGYKGLPKVLEGIRSGEEILLSGKNFSGGISADCSEKCDVFIRQWRYMSYVCSSINTLH